VDAECAVHFQRNKGKPGAGSPAGVPQNERGVGIVRGCIGP